MIAILRIFGTGFSNEPPEGFDASLAERIFAPAGLPLADALGAQGIQVSAALPREPAQGDVMLLPGGPEPDDPWLHASVAHGAAVRWNRPLVLACDLPPGTLSRHAASRAPWPAGQGVVLYGAAPFTLPDALLALAEGALIGSAHREVGALQTLAERRRPGELLYVPPFGGETALPLAAATAVMSRLKAPGGCPWDREQTHESLLPFLLEEAAEVYDALLADDLHGTVEELGDLYLQVLFHAELGREEGTFSLAEVADGLWRKLVRRHPHVFGDEHYASAQDFLPRWEQLKAEEGTRRQSELDGIPASLSSLAAIEKAIRKLMRCGIRQLGEGGYTALFEARVAAGEDLEAEARRSLASLKARCRRAEVILGSRLSAADPEEAAEAWQRAQDAQVAGTERRNDSPIDES